MPNLTLYADPGTGYEVRRYTTGPHRNSKLYFTTENFTPDDQFFFMNSQTGTEGLPTGSLCKVHYETGEVIPVAGPEYKGFAMDRQRAFGVMCKGDIVCRLDVDSGDIMEIGQLPTGGQVTGHLTTADTGRIACSYHLANKIYALVTLDPATGKSEVVYQSDQRLGHAQICPTDENLLFYIYETEGDALQRTWMFDIKARRERPYYVEHPEEWITHEVWSADGSRMAFMKLPGNIMVGDKDGRHFDKAAYHEQSLHPCISRDNQWLCADRTSYLGVTVKDAIVLANPRNGKTKVLCDTGAPKSGADHQHPSFDRSGDRIIFNNPDGDGTAQVCVIDLRQVARP
ncbi:MAG: oligogalacturonate lyase family protein [Oscillospiraceae bacterium]|jgi:oligogalacturonide lyase|nr:oligogalacturonate lyase family protein [Oscillospiraceae bacterium]